MSIAKAFEDNPHETSDPLPEYDKKAEEAPKVLTEQEELAMKHRLERQKTLKEQVRETNNALLKQQTRINEKRTQLKKARRDRMFLPNVSQVKKGEKLICVLSEQDQDYGFYEDVMEEIKAAGLQK